MIEQIRRWHYQPDNEFLIRELRDRICTIANEVIRKKNSFSIVLSGGSTPKYLYQQLATIKTEWSCWSIFWGDERCLPVGDAERNDTMARQSWLNRVAIPASQIHSIDAHFGKIAADSYATLVSSIENFDLVLLGLGEDGHTASLFPAEFSETVDVASPVIYVNRAPKPPAERISLSSSRLSSSDAVWFLALGESKKTILQAWKNGASIPAAYIVPPKGVDIFTDQLLD